MEFTPGTMEKLVELLKPTEPDILQGEDMASTGVEITSNRGQSQNIEVVDKTPKTIEEFEEQEAREADELSRVGGGISSRKVPKYTINYRQSVTAEDVFLQIGPKTPASASCENLIVRIKMPGDKMKNIELSVDAKSVTVNSSQHFLNLPLPHEVNPDMSKATWDSVQETLILTLKLDREFDFVNF